MVTCFEIVDLANVGINTEIDFVAYSTTESEDGHTMDVYDLEFQIQVLKTRTLC